MIKRADLQGFPEKIRTKLAIPNKECSFVQLEFNSKINELKTISILIGATKTDLS